MLFRPYACFVALVRLVVLCLAVLASLPAQADPPNFFVTVTIPASPPVNELLLVTNNPFGYSVVTATNSESQTITNNPGEAILDFSPDGTLYGMAGDILSIINPSTAATSDAVTLSNAVMGAATAGAALAFGNDGTLYLSDGYSLYTVNGLNGVCTPIQPFHANGTSAKLTTPIYGLAVGANGTLFGGDLNLYTINPATAAVTPVGMICASPWFARALDMAFGSDGNLYMIGQDFFGDTALYSVDTNNAAVSLVGALPGRAFGLVTSISPAAPAITDQPVSQTVAPGGTANFSVTATGLPAPTWYFDSAPYPSATNFTLTLTNVSATNAGSYFVVLANSSGAVTSAVVTLTVASQVAATNFTFLATAVSSGGPAAILSLSTNPLSETVLANVDASLKCLAFNTNNVLYGAGNVLFSIDTNSWNPVPISPILTGTGSALTLTSMAFSPQNVLFGVAGNALYSINTSNAQAIQLTGYPVNVFISAIAFGPKGVLYGGEDDLYTLNATNGTIVSVIGPLLGPGSNIGSDMKAGADGYLYFGNGGDMNLYRLNPVTAFVTKAASFNSVLAGLAFYPAPFDVRPPAITSPQTNLVAALGATVTFSANVTGAGVVTYQWFNGSIRLQDGSRVTGSATSSLTLSNLMASDAGTYTLTVSNAFGVATRIAATLTVGAGPVITVQPVATTRIVEGKSLTLNVTAKAGTTSSNLLYQWMDGDTIIPGATDRTLTVTANPTNGVSDLFYTVFIRNNFGVALSAPAQISVLPNPVKPTVAITVPAANARTISNVISGTFSAGAVQVMYWTTNLNQGVITTNGPFAATLGSGSTWSATAAWLPGTNILSVQSSNQDGDVSTLVSRPFFYEVKSPLTLASVGGSGTFTSKAAVTGDTIPASGALLNIGEGYSITVKPAADSLFVNWTEANGVATTTTLNFVMESNFSLTADFTTNQFFGLAGVYNGLFPENGAVTEESAGMISGLTLTNTGIYSGALVLEGVSYRFSGAFNRAGQSSNSIARTGGALLVQMTLQTNNYPNQILGLVSGPGWQSDLHLIAKATGPLASTADTMILPPPTNFAGGYGYAVITNHAGSISFAGKLADGTIFSPTVALSQAKNVPFYASLYGNTGILTGWLDFDTGQLGAEVPQGQLTWIRPPGKAGSLYSSGFTNVVTVQGSSWVALAGLPFTTATPGVLQIFGGNLAAPLSFQVAIGSNNGLVKLSASGSTNSLTGTINAKTGLLTVTFGHGKGKAITGTGVVLQSLTNAFGAFLGTTNSGVITLVPE